MTRDTVELMIAQTLPQFGIRPCDIAADSTFEDLDLDHLDLAELWQIIDEEYGVRLSVDELRLTATIGDAVDIFMSRAT